MDTETQTALAELKTMIVTMASSLCTLQALVRQHHDAIATLTTLEQEKTHENPHV